MTIASFGQEIKDIYARWTNGDIDYFEKERLVSAAERQELGSVKQALIVLLGVAEKPYPISDLVKEIVRQGFKDTDASHALVLLINETTVQLSDDRQVSFTRGNGKSG